MGDEDGGVLFMGDKGILVCSCYGKNPTFLPEPQIQDFEPPAETLERIPNGSR